MKYLSIAIVLVLFACEKECFQKAGPVEIVKRELRDFQSLSLEGPVSIELLETPEAFVLIEATPAFSELIVFEEKGDQLHLSIDQSCGLLNKPDFIPKLKLSLPSLKHIYYSGTAALWTNDTLRRDSFELECWNSAGDIQLQLDVNTLVCANHIGPSDIQLSGKADLCYVYSGDIGFMDFRNLRANGVYLNHEGLGDVYIYASHTLEAEMKSHGRLYFAGDPTHLTITGSSAHKVFTLEP